MNELHLKYKKETGKNAYSEINIYQGLDATHIQEDIDLSDNNTGAISLIKHELAENYFDCIKVDNSRGTERRFFYSDEYIEWLEENLKRLLK